MRNRNVRSVLLYVHRDRPYGPLGTGSPGRPPRLSHSSWPLKQKQNKQTNKKHPFHPRVTTVARKKSRSFCQKCRCQVTAKHAYTLRMWILLNRASAFGHNLSLICQMTSEDIKHQLIIIKQKTKTKNKQQQNKTNKQTNKTTTTKSN